MTFWARSLETRASSRRIARLAALAILAAAWVAGCRTAPKAPEAGAIADYLEAAERAWGFRGAVLVARRGEVVFSGGFGAADAAGTRANAPSTRFSIGSATKAFTAAAVLSLRDAGLVDLDDPLADYVPEYSPSEGEGVTLRRLLSHSAGVPDLGLDPRTLGDLTRPRSPLELIGPIMERPLDFKPGERAQYSNAGYALLGLVVERAGGMPYADFVRERLLDPLGMGRTGYGPDDGTDPDVAEGLLELADGRTVAAPRFHPSLGYSAGGLYSTVEDLRLWDRGLAAGRVLSDDSRELMFTPGPGGFGLGWLVMETWGRKDIAHGGGAPGYGAWIERWPDDEAFVAVLSNVGNAPVGEIGRSLAAILFGRETQTPRPRLVVPAAPDSWSELVGSYRIENGGIREVLREGDRLFVRRDGGANYPILPGRPDLYFFPNDKGATIRFVRDTSGRVTGHVFHQLGIDERAVKTAETDKEG